MNSRIHWIYRDGYNFCQLQGGCYPLREVTRPPRFVMLSQMEFKYPMGAKNGGVHRRSGED